MKISLDSNVGAVVDAMNKYEKSVIEKATRQGLLRATKTLNAQIGKKIRTEYRGISKTDIANKVRKRQRLDTSVDRMNSMFYLDAKPLTLMRFKKGRKTPERQKGKSIRSRILPTFSVRRGKTFQRFSTFVAKPKKGGQVQVFTRGSDGKLRIQRAPSISNLFRRTTRQGSREPSLDTILEKTGRSLQKNTKSSLRFYHSQLVRGISK